MLHVLDADVCIHEQSGLTKQYVVLIVSAPSKASCLLGCYTGLTRMSFWSNGDLGEAQEKGNTLGTQKINSALL